MAAPSTSQAARARILGVFSAPLDRILSEDERIPLKGATLADFEDPVETLAQAALPRSVRHWSLTTLRQKLIKVGAKVVRLAKSVTFQMAEVAVPRELFAAILERSTGLVCRRRCCNADECRDRAYNMTFPVRG